MRATVGAGNRSRGKISVSHRCELGGTLGVLCSQAFRESCQRFYEAELEELSFAEDTEECRRHINDWVTERTEGEACSLPGLGTWQGDSRGTAEIAGAWPPGCPLGPVASGLLVCVCCISRPAAQVASFSRVYEVTEWYF